MRGAVTESRSTVPRNDKQDRSRSQRRSSMGLFTRLFGKGQPPEPDDLRQQLFSAPSTAALLRLCRRHADLIRQHFPAWRTVPVQVREHPAQAQHYMEGMVAVAQTFE